MIQSKNIHNELANEGMTYMPPTFSDATILLKGKCKEMLNVVYVDNL